MFSAQMQGEGPISSQIWRGHYYPRHDALPLYGCLGYLSRMKNIYYSSCYFFIPSQQSENTLSRGLHWCGVVKYC